MADETEEPTKARTRVADIVTLGAEIFGIPPEGITGHSRFLHLCRARQAVYLIAREHGHSFPQIGRYAGGKDHSSVIHGCNKAVIIMRYDPEYAAKVCELRMRASECAIFLPPAEKKPRREAVRAAAARIRSRPAKEPVERPVMRYRNAFDNSEFKQELTQEQMLARGSAMLAKAIIVERARASQSAHVMIG